MLEAYQRALGSQPPTGITPRPYDLVPKVHLESSSGTPDNSSTVYGSPRPLAAVRPLEPKAESLTEIMSPEAELRQQLHRLLERLQSLEEQANGSSSSPHPFDLQSQALAEAERNLEKERARRKKMAESVADLKEDVNEKERRYKELRRKRREVEASLADARTLRETRQHDEAESKKLQDILESRDRLRKLLEARRQEVSDCVDARKALEKELEEIKQQAAVQELMSNMIPSIGVALPKLVQAFNDLQNMDSPSMK